MAEAKGISKTAGRAGTLFAWVGIIAFFLGLFGPVRNVVFFGVGLIVLAIVSYFVEETTSRGYL